LLNGKDSIAYFFENVLQIGTPDYIPSNEDLVIMRNERRNVKFTLRDTGGQRNERRKWVHHFHNADAVLFATSIGEFDEVCFEDEKANRIQEILECFTLHFPEFKGKT
jgi:hypothetical protein